MTTPRVASGSFIRRFSLHRYFIIRRTAALQTIPQLFGRIHLEVVLMRERVGKSPPTLRLFLYLLLVWVFICVCIFIYYTFFGMFTTVDLPRHHYVIYGNWRLRIEKVGLKEYKNVMLLGIRSFDFNRNNCM